MRIFCALCLAATLGVFAACDQSLKLAPLAPDAVVLAFGDSLTAGTGASHEQSYPTVLAALIGRTVVNAGVPGETSEEGLARLPSVLQREAPSLLILCHGGNDFLRRLASESTSRNLQAMVQIAQDLGIEVVMLGVPQPGLFLSTADLYHDVASATGVALEADIIPDVLGDNRHKSDTVHPNADGYALMASAIRKLLEDNGAL